MSLRITTDTFEAEVLQSDVPVVADFYSDSCIPCKRVSPLLAELEEQYAGRFKLCKISAVNDQALTEQYNVLTAPTLIFFRDGRERDRKTGFVGKDTLIESINKLLEG